MTERIRRRAIVRGDVQGVGFRWSTAIQAQRLGLAGETVNRRDGTVEVVAEGDSAAVRTLLAWLQEGPPTARVDGVTVTEEDPTGEQGFRAG